VTAFFRDLLDHPIALGTVHNIVQESQVQQLIIARNMLHKKAI
jgi:hypothetical protein